MYPLGHAGFAVALGAWAARRWPLPPRWPLWAGLGAVLPYLLDKPPGLLVLGLGEGRLLGHTLPFALAWVAGGYAWKRSWTAAPVLVGAGCLTHLLLDLPLAATVFWPLLGPFPLRGYGLGDLVPALLARPALLVGEVAGAVVLLATARRGRRGRPPARRRSRPAGRMT